MKYQQLVFAAAFFGITTLSNANPRLETVQQIYTQQVDEFAQSITTEKINRVYAGLMTYFQDAFGSFDKKVDLVKIAETWFNGNRTLVGQILTRNEPASLKRFKNLKHDVQDANTAKAQFSEKSQHLECRSSALEELKNDLEKRDLCNEFISKEIYPELPRYIFDEEIHTSHIPKPTLKNIGGFADSGNVNLDKVAAGAVGTMSSAGCAIGTMLGGPFAPLGCAAGAAIGALAGFLVGYTAQASYIGFENWQVWSAYENMVSIEAARQRNEINEAKDFTVQHPINIDLVLDRSIRLCLSMENALINLGHYNTKEPASVFVSKVYEADSELTTYQQILKNDLQDLKETLFKQNPVLLENRLPHFTEIKMYQNLVIAIDGMRLPLYQCFYESKQSIEYKKNCLNLALKETKILFQENRQNFNLVPRLKKIFLDWTQEISLFENQFGQS